MPALEQILDTLNQALSDFIALLEEEAAALASQDGERLSALLPRRDQAHHTLAGQWQRLAELTGTPHLSGLASLREKLFAQSTPSAAWQRLEQLAHAADRLNRVNGRLIEEQMRRTQSAMQVLQNTLSSRNVYGADGRVTDLLNVNRKIDSA